MHHRVSSWGSMMSLWLEEWKACLTHLNIWQKRGLYPSLPFFLPKSGTQLQISDFVLECRKGSRLGHDSLVDGMLKDGLWDVYNDCSMGTCAELCAEQHSITRENQVLDFSDSWISSVEGYESCIYNSWFISSWFLQDDFAVQSFERGIAAQDAGAFAWEIVPVRHLVIFSLSDAMSGFVLHICILNLMQCRLKFLREGENHQPLLIRMKV